MTDPHSTAMTALHSQTYRDSSEASMKRTRCGSAALLLVAVLLGGCSESVMIRSGPSGANVFVNDKPVGKTPVEYTVPRGDLGNPYHVRIEKNGYEPVVTNLSTRIAGGRVTGAVFTLGILAMFRSMYYIQPVFAQLQPLVSPQDDRDRVLGESLRNLRELHERGKISDEEFQRRQTELLQSK